MACSWLRVGFTALSVVLVTRAENIALRKRAYSSSEESQFNPGTVASANDGNTGVAAGVEPGCFQTETKDVAPYWLVDLGQPFNIANVTLTNRDDLLGYGLTDFTIELYMNDPRPLFDSEAGQLCGGSAVETPVGQGATEVFPCGQAPLTGRWVAVRKNGTNLSLCEVEVVKATDEEVFQNFPCAFNSETNLCGFSQPGDVDFDLTVTKTGGRTALVAAGLPIDHSPPPALVNAALNKPVTQSSSNPAYKSQQLVDGKTALCASTAAVDPSQDRWFRVDLEKSSEVVAVVVTDSDFEILVSPTLPDPLVSRPEGSLQCVQQEQQAYSGSTLRADCTQPVEGRYVTLLRSNSSSSWIACELEVLTRNVITGLHVPATASLGHQGKLNSPILAPSTPQACLTFWYSAGLSEKGPPVAVLTSLPDLNGVTPVWTSDLGVSPLDPDVWRHAVLTLDTTAPVRVIFNFTVLSQGSSDGLDDVSLTTGPCRPEQPLNDSFACSLEAPDLCGLGQLVADNDTFDWRWVPSRPNDTTLSRPGADHTTGSGHYLFVDRSSLARPEDSAVLYTPTITPTLHASCLTFAYILQGDNSGGLQVLAAPSPFSLDGAFLLWNGTGEKEGDWKTATVDFPANVDYKIFIKAGHDPNYDFGIIAMDDIAIVNRHCPPSSIFRMKCSFEFPCYLQESEDDDLDWSTVTGPHSDPSGPSSDHTGSNGAYLALNGSQAGQTARLLSPEVNIGSAQSCLTFWQHVQYGRPPGAGGSLPAPPAALNSSGQVSVWLLPAHDAELNNTQLLWRLDRGQGGEWRRTALTIDTSSHVKFMIEGTMGEPGQSTVAIDDIELNKGPCLFDLQFNTIECDFNAANLCGFQQSGDDDFDWFQREGPAPDVATTGPARDHTGQSKDSRRQRRSLQHGGYLYMESSWPQQPGDKARLLSPSLQSSSPKNCLTFWYHMSGDSVGSLAVSMRRQAGGATLLWMSSGTQGPVWKMASLQLTINDPFRLIFEGTVGQGDTGDIAIDDVWFSNGPCADQATVECDFSDSFLCGYQQAKDDAFDWTFTKGDKSMGPRADHTTGDGGFVYAGEYLPKSVLVSSSLNWKSTNTCLAFQLFMLGDAMGSLNVYTAPSGMLSQRTLVWSMTGNDNNTDFTFYSVELDTTYPVQVLLEGVEDAGSSGIIALNDVVLMPGDCNNSVVADCMYDPDHCGFTKLTNSAEDDHDWFIVTQNETGNGYLLQPSNVSQVDHTQPAVLQSPVLTGQPDKMCLSFWYSMPGRNQHVTVRALRVDSGSTIASWSEPGHGKQGWTEKRIDFDLTAPMFFQFEATRVYLEDRLVADIALDDITVTNGTCGPVPWTPDPAFRCDRPTTPCAPGRGACDPNLHTCTCTPPGALGLQCSLDATPCTSTDPCERGTCNNQTGVATCSCPDGYYGDRCQHKMVYAECTNDTMTINIFPHGFHDNNFTLIQSPEIANTSCSLLDVSTLDNSSGVDAVSRGWQGYAGQFLMDEDPCAGRATLVSQDRWTKTYSHQVHVHYDPLGRHPTDTVLTLTCTTPTPPEFEPKVTITAQELGVSAFSLPPEDTPEGPQWPAYIQFSFSLNIPNTGHSNEISVERCTTSNGVQTVVVIENGCVIHPVGVVLYDGTEPGIEFFIMRVFKRPATPAKVGLQCSVRLCDSRKNNFACYTRKLCWSEGNTGNTGNNVRRRRSTAQLGGTLTDVSYVYTL